ncbi:MAG: hypothetical protein II817_09835 [Bacteroidales bacterium]|nr:hypothetical protein [Bacteroidales bacterium]
MKKVFTLIVGMMLTMTAFAQKTVAVYVTANEGVTQEIKKVLGSELVAAITKTADYVAVERTADFMEQISKEQGYYEINDAALYDLGRKFGASNICVADVTKFGEEYYIVARLLDIKTSKVWKTAKKYSTLKSLRELVEISETLANDLFGSTNEFSTYAYGDNVDNNSFITKIENRDNYTKVTLKYVSVNPKQTLGIARNAYIEDMTTHQKYMLTDAANINILDQNNKLGKQIGSGIWEYHLFFDRISEDALNIAIVEPNGRKYNDIVLRPYDDENTFVFIDNTQKLYDEMKKQKENQYENEQIEKIDSKDIVVSYYNREAVKGLKYVTTIKTTNNNQPGWPNVCIRKMKKEAAKLGCKAIVIIDETKFRHFDSPSSLTGELYK